MNYQNSTIKNNKQPKLKNGEKPWTDITEKEIQMANKHTEGCSALEPQWAITTHLSEWLKF